MEDATNFCFMPLTNPKNHSQVRGQGNLKRRAYCYNQSLTHRLQAHKLTNSGRKWHIHFFQISKTHQAKGVQCRSTQHWGQGKAVLAQGLKKHSEQQGVIQWDWFLQGEPPSLMVLSSVCSIGGLLQAEVGPVD